MLHSIFQRDAERNIATRADYNLSRKRRCRRNGTLGAKENLYPNRLINYVTRRIEISLKARKLAARLAVDRCSRNDLTAVSCIIRAPSLVANLYFALERAIRRVIRYFLSIEREPESLEGIPSRRTTILGKRK